MNQGILSLIGNTPIVKLSGFDIGPCELFIKLETQNPGGSIKDRIGLSMIEEAEKQGLINKDTTLIEATAGNTGIGLALVASCKGYKLKLVVPDKMSIEKISLLKAMGAEVILTRSDVEKGHPEYYQDKADSLSKSTPNSYYINQFANPANPLAHETSTGPEIYDQMNGQVDAVICGVGSGGTITGLSKFFAKKAKDCEIVLADPIGSILAPYVNTGNLPAQAGSWFVEGIGEDFIPSLLDLSRVKKAYAISDQESIAAAQQLLKTNAILGGSSTGTLLAAAVKYCQEQKQAKRVVTFACDTGNRYLSKVYNQAFLAGEGLVSRAKHGDLRDYVFHTYAEGSTIFVRAEDTVSTAFKRMKMFSLSQLPVLEGNRVIGLIDESDILNSVLNQPNNFSALVSSAMTHNPILLEAQEPLEKLLDIIKNNMVGIIVVENSFYGLVTRTDLISFCKLSALS
jgi:cystathionine beta-synthase